MRGGEIHGARPEMVGAFFGGGPRGGGMQIGVADDGEVVAIGRERLQRLAELEIGALLGGRPVMLLRAFAGAAGGAVHHFDAAQSAA